MIDGACEHDSAYYYNVGQDYDTRSSTHESPTHRAQLRGACAPSVDCGLLGARRRVAPPTVAVESRDAVAALFLGRVERRVRGVEQRVGLCEPRARLARI